MAERITLYGGAVEIEFEKDSHTYYVRDNDDFDPQFKLYPSVTTILHQGVNKADVLVPWAVNSAIEVFNEMVLPGHTYDEVDLKNIVSAMRQARYNKKNKAADIGTVAHEWLKVYLQHWIDTGEKYDDQVMPTNTAAASCVTGALGWIEKSGFTPTLTEKIIFSRKHQYIGTMDATSSKATVYGRKAVVDWKSTKDIYPEMRFQVAAYLNAIAEESGLDPMDYDRWLVKLGKEDGDFKETKLPRDEYKKDLAAFVGMIPMYHRMSELNKAWKDKRRG